MIGQLHGAVTDHGHFCAVRREGEGLGRLHRETPMGVETKYSATDIRRGASCSI